MSKPTTRRRTSLDQRPPLKCAELSPEDKAKIRAAVRALPPLSEDALDEIALILEEIREERRRRDGQASRAAMAVNRG